jgi:hypothetical protein
MMESWDLCCISRIGTILRIQSQQLRCLHAMILGMTLYGLPKSFYDSNLEIVRHNSFGAGAKPNLVLGDSSTHAFTASSNNGVSALQSR